MTSFAVSQFTTWNQTFEQDVQLYASLGIGAIEVCERKLSTDPGRALAQLQRVREYGLTVTSVQPRCHALFVDGMCPDVHDPDQRAARFRGTIDLIARAFPGEPIPLVAIAGRAPDHDHRRAHGIARRIYPQLADYAADHGVRIMFEPLNPILMNVDTFICTFDEAARLIDDVARDNFGMMLDLWHVWRERDIAARIAQYDGSRIFGVHVCDWPAGEPRHFSDRALPGEGIIDLPVILRAIERSGYDGAYCLEIFSGEHLPDSLWRLDPVDVIRRGRQGFDNAWKQRR